MTRHRFIRLLLSTLAAAGVFQASHGAGAQIFSPEDDARPAPVFAPQTGAWPKLVADDAPGVCGRYLDALKRSFKGSDFYVSSTGWHENLLFEIEPYNDQMPRGAKELKVLIGESRLKPNYALVRTDVDQDGAAEGLLFVWHYHSWRGHIYGVRLIPPTLLKTVETALEEDADTLQDLFSKGVKILRREALWTPPKVYETEDGAVYITSQFSGSFAPEPYLDRVGASGATQACLVEVYPPQADTGAAFTELMRNLTRAQGVECYGGTLNPLRRLQLSNRTSRRNAAFRPWALKTPYNTRDALNYSLENWSFSDPWSRRVYLDIAELHEKAVKETVQSIRPILAGNLSAEDAEPYAEEIIWRAVGAHFIFPSGGYPGLKRVQENPAVARLYRDVETPSDLRAVFDDAGHDAGKAEYLFALIDKPRLLPHMTELGADINARDAYGKTALMYAAQLNNEDAVDMLLSLGADINLKTFKAEPSYGYRDVCRTAHGHGRTALTYAAASASHRIVERLIKAGADTSATVGNRSIANFLDANTQLTERQRKNLKNRLPE